MVHRKKKQLLNIGYYHGYKGYRYIKKSTNQIIFTDFNEIKAIYDFDMELKALLYPHIMFIETALKNRVLDVVINEANSSNFNVIYSSILTNYQSYKIGSIEYREALSKRMALCDNLYNLQTKAYCEGNNIATHFAEKSLSLPLWAIFELITLGEFGFFVTTIKSSTRLNISKSLKFRVADDTSGKLLQRLIETMRYLRNSIAHNSVIFDTRFQGKKIHKQVKTALENETLISNIDFSDFTDYIILIVFVLKHLNTSKTEMKRFVSEFRKLTNTLYSTIPSAYYTQIIHTDARLKLHQLERYISK